jgi:phenylacetate-coenzyme A ligase PaaK-like adenylate-forming protein
MTVDAFGDFASLRDRVQAEMIRRLPDHLSRLRLDAEQIARRQRDGLRSLLRHAVARSPFHARRLAGLDPELVELADLPHLPVMTKNDLMADFDDVLTDRRLSRALCERALAATRDEPRALFGEVTCLASGGSSGQRGVFVLDADATTEFLSSLNRRVMERLLAQGGPPPEGVRVAMVAAASAVHATGCAPAWTEGGPVRIVGIPVTSPLDAIVARLEELQPQMLYGYPSMLVRLARERAAGRLAIAPLGINSTSETLLPEWRTTIQEAFQVPVVNVFGSSEGLVGHSAPGEVALVFNTDVCIVELVDEDDRPVPPGVPSARILVTNLANRVQPLVRYEISDRFVRLPDAPDHGHLRATVEGRSDDVLRWGATEVHPLVVRGVMVKEPRVTDYQVRQTPRGMEVAVLASAPLDTAGLRGALCAALSGAGLRDADVVVSTVAALERHPETGKVRRFIPC